MSLACKWLEEHHNAIPRAAICTDSLSLLQGISNNSLDIQQICNEFTATNSESLLKFVPGHTGIPGNEIADQAAKDATKLPRNPASATITLEPAVSCIKCEVRDHPTTHPLITAHYKHINNTKDSELLTN